MKRIMYLMMFLVVASPAWAVTPPKQMWWTSARETRRQALRTSNHAWWQRILSRTDSVNNPTNEDRRTAGAIYYQLTGDTSLFSYTYGGASIHLKGADTDPSTVNNAKPDSSRNFTREHFMEFAFMYDWYYGALSSAQKSNWIDSLNNWADLCLEANSLNNWGTRTSDSDETVGHYFGVITWALVSAPDNAAKSASLLSNSTIGGLDATGANKNTWRNAINEYVTNRANNGAWIESSQYDYGTLQLLLMGADAVETITGVDHFPEITALRKQMAYYNITMATPNRSDAFKYGANDLDQRNLGTSRRKPLSNILINVLRTDATIAPYLNDYQNLMTDQPNWRDFIFGDPQSTAMTDYRTGMPQSFVDEKRGLFSYHDDWTNANGSAFYTWLATNSGVDHKVDHFGTWNLYRKGAWAISAVVGYDVDGTDDDQSLCQNTMIIGGLPTMQEVRHVFADEAQTDFAYIVGATAGNRYNAGDVTNAPNRYLHEWTRSMVYLPSTDASVDTVVLIDRVNSDDSATVFQNANYKNSSGQPDLTRVQGAAFRKAWYLHAPVAPSVSTNDVTWTNSGTTVDLKMYLPLAANRSVAVDLPTTWPSGVIASERSGRGSQRIRIGETPNTKFSIFANIVQAYTTTGITSTLIKTADAVGFLISRTSHNDYVVLFNAAQGPDIPNSDTSGTYTPNAALPGIVNQNRLRTTGYTVTVPAGSSSSRKLLVFDLDPSLSWTTSIDGGTATACTVTTSAPVCKRAYTQAGSHTVAIATSSSPPVTDTTAPTVTITAPLQGATVSGTLDVTADASDDVGVVGVQFKLDGSNLGAEDTNLPYSVSWNTLGSSNASHTITATARDAAGNTTTTELISFDAASSQVCNSSCTNTLTWNHTVGSGAHSLLAVCAAAEGTSANTPLTGVTYNGTALTKVDAQSWGAGAENVELWYLLNPAAGTHSVIETFTGTIPGGSTGIASSYFGVNQSGQPDASNKTTASATTNLTVDVTTATNNSWVIDCVADQSSGHTITVGSGQTSNGIQTSVGNLVSGSSFEGPKATAGAVTMNWTSSANATYGIVGGAFKPSTGGVTVTVSNSTPGALVNVVSTTGTGSSVVGTLATGQTLYTDRTYTIVSLPSYLNGLEYVRTANNDRTNGDASYLTLSLASDATLFVVFNAVDAIPGWLDSTWTLRAETVDTTDDAGDARKIYSRTYDAGSVVLGGKNYPPGSGTESNYFIVAAPVFVEVTVPTAAATVSGASVTVTADVGTTTNVSGVQMKLDGSNLGAEDTSSPYTITWDSTAAGNGSHTLSAVLRRSDGTLYASQGIAVTVSNSQADVTPPVLSSISAGDPSETAATITWTTDEAATSQVQYGLDSSYGTTTTLAPALVTSHSVSLTGLTQNTTYHYAVVSSDQAGNTATSSDQTFATDATPDTTAPTVSSVTAGALTTTSIESTFVTNEVGDTRIRYATTEAGLSGATPQITDEDVTNHTIDVTSLSAGTLYYYQVASQDPSSNTSSWSTAATVSTLAAPDVTAPTVSNIAVTLVDANTVTVTYDTDESGDSELQYGTDTTYGSSASDATDVLAHSLTLSNLTSSTTYHYQVRSTDPSNNTSAWSTDATFLTPEDTQAPTPTSQELRKVGLYLLQISGGTVGQ